jgi:hypothetical protein
MAASLRERPSITGKDADRLISRITENNIKHQKLVERMVAKNSHAKDLRVRTK